jgi:hypothetical protein
MADCGYDVMTGPGLARSTLRAAKTKYAAPAGGKRDYHMSVRVSVNTG